MFHLLDFGSGYDPQLLRQSGGRDARETLLYGIIGLHLGGTRLDCHKLKWVWERSWGGGRGVPLRAWGPVRRHNEQQGPTSFRGNGTSSLAPC